MTAEVGSVAVVWRGAPHERPAETRNYTRLQPIFTALNDAGIAVVPILYCDQIRDAVRDQLLRVDGVLVWVDPIGGDEDRTQLDGLLREVASLGVWVSAHPDTIDKMGTKEVLHRTKDLGWGTDTRLYANPSEFRAHFPECLAAAHPRVLKQNRGNGGIGVWKVALVDDTSRHTTTTPTAETMVRVQHAAPRDNVTEDLALGVFIERCNRYFERGGKLIDQPFVTRLADGMIRAYLVVGDVVGYARQQPAVPATATNAVPPDNVLGMPSGKTMYNADEPTFDALRTRLEHEWVPGLRTMVGLEETELPLIWDADFLHGAPADSRANAYVLCEINASSVLPFPGEAPLALALAVQQRLAMQH
jgi:hypothetical protein